jgi:nucleotide-binding universal stress UspA family protein
MTISEKTKILIPLDGSAIGESILLSIYPLLQARQVESTLFHAAETPQTIEGVEAHLAAQQKALESKGVATRIRIVSGKPAQQIVRQAETGGFDLIAMATHGRSGLDRVVMGSVAEEVVRTSPVPTLLCKSGTRTGPWDRIVVALDGTPGSEEVLGDVVRLARSLQSTVHLLQVGLGLLLSDGYRGVAFRYTSDVPPSYLETVAARLSTQGVTAVPERRQGMAGVEIAALARQLDAGLICMTTEGRPEELPGMDRSVAAAVIRSAPCPVYVRRMSRVAGAAGGVRKE